MNGTDSPRHFTGHITFGLNEGTKISNLVQLLGGSNSENPHFLEVNLG